MHPFIHCLTLLITMGLTTFVAAQLPNDVKSDLGPDVPANFRVRPGYRVTRAAASGALRGARFLQFSGDGKTLFISDRKGDAIYALRDPDSDGVYKTITTFVKDKDSVHGMDFNHGWLWFQQPSQGSISRARDTNGDGVADDVEVIIPSKTLPKPGNHPYNALLVTDKEIYVSASDPTNMTEELDSPSKKIYIFDLDGKNQRVFCSGVRNNEELRFRPGTSEIWGLDHGSDNFGQKFGEKTGKDQPITDHNPPEELNHYVQDGFYGHPYIMGNRVPRPEFAERADIIELANRTIVAEWLIPAHWAANGFTFITGDYFPGQKGDLWYASHGSWNSLKPVGSVVQRIMFDAVTGKPCGTMTIVDCGGEGTNRRNRPARPVDCAEAPDGTMLFSSDEPTGLYRISKSGATASP